MPGGGYGVGLFDSNGPEAFAKSIDKITKALTGVSSGFTNFGSAASKSLSGLGSTIDSLIKKLGDLQKMTNQTVGGGGGGGGGGAPSSGGGSYSGGSGGTGAAGGNRWQSPGGGGPGGFDQGPTDSGQGSMTLGSAGEVLAQMKDQWGRMPEGTPTPNQQSMVSPGNDQSTALGRAAGSMIPAAFGAAAKSLQSGAAGNLVAAAIQGQSIGQMMAPAFGVSQRSMYVIPNGVLAQNPQDVPQSNYYAATQMGVAPGTANWSTIQQGANQLMTLMPNMTRQQAMVTQNAMQQPGVLNAGLMFGMNFKPQGKMMAPQQQYDMIFNKLFTNFPGGKPSGDQFESYMAPGGPGENNLAAMGITPGSDQYNGFMQYALTKIGLNNQGKAMPTDIGTKAGAKQAGLNTSAYSMLQAQTAKSQTESRAEPGLAAASKNLNDAATALFKAVGPLAGLGGNVAGFFGGSKGLLGGIPGMSTIGSLGSHLPGGVGGIIKSIFQQGGLVPGSGPQLAVVHGGEYVLTKDDVDKMQGKKGGQGAGAGTALGAVAAGGGGGKPLDKTTVIGMLGSKPTDISTTVLAMLLTPPAPNTPLAALGKAGAPTGGTGGSASTSTSTWNYNAAGGTATDLSGMFGGGSTASSSGGAGASAGTNTSAGTAAGTPPSGNVASWISKAMQVAGVAGTAWTNGLNLIIQHESSGNPNAQNNSDSNAAAGHPSQGLMQEIPTTFQEYALPGYNTNIRDPVSNIVAGIRYIQSRYGGIGNVPGVVAVGKGQPYVGYARGSQLIDRNQLAMLHKGEAVIPAADNYSTTPYNRGGAVGGNTAVHLNFKAGSVVLQVPANSTQQDMDALAQQFVSALSKPQNLASVRSS